MNVGDERLRELLRAADPAREGAELSETDAARMRRSVLDAAEVAPMSWLTWPTLGLAAVAAVVIALALGVVLWRATALRESLADGAQAAASPADRAPSNQALQGASSTRPAAPMRSTAAAAPMPAPDAALIAATTPTAPHGSAPSPRRRMATDASPRTDRRPPSPSAEASQDASSRTDSTGPDALAAAQPEQEPRPYQIQLTAPGGTRIVWLLTAPSGR